MTTKKVARSAITGQFVTKPYAVRHPKTTEMERIKIPSKKG